MRITCADRAPMHFITAMESSFCCKCPCIALATPMAPITSAISPIRLRNVVERSNPRVMMGCVCRVVGNGGFRKRLLQNGAHFRYVRPALRRQREQVALGRATARRDQPRAVQPLARDHHSRPDVEASGHAVRFRHHHAGDAEILAADVQHVAGAHVEAAPADRRTRLRTARRGPRAAASADSA